MQRITCAAVHGNSAPTGHTLGRLRSSDRNCAVRCHDDPSWLRKVAASASPPNLGLTVLGQKQTLDNDFSSFQAAHRTPQRLAPTCSAQALCPLQACAGNFLREASLALGQVPCWSFIGSEFLLHSSWSEPPVRLRAGLEHMWAVCVLGALHVCAEY